MAPEIVVSKILNIFWLIRKKENLASQEDKENTEGNAQKDFRTNSSTFWVVDLSVENISSEHWKKMTTESQ